MDEFTERIHRSADEEGIGGPSTFNADSPVNVRIHAKANSSSTSSLSIVSEPHFVPILNFEEDKVDKENKNQSTSQVGHKNEQWIIGEGVEWNRKELNVLYKVEWVTYYNISASQ